jgi:hypothetical protein
MHEICITDDAVQKIIIINDIYLCFYSKSPFLIPSGGKGNACGAV